MGTYVPSRAPDNPARDYLTVCDAEMYERKREIYVHGRKLFEVYILYIVCMCVCVVHVSMSLRRFSRPRIAYATHRAICNKLCTALLLWVHALRERVESLGSCYGKFRERFRMILFSDSIEFKIFFYLIIPETVLNENGVFFY